MPKLVWLDQGKVKEIVVPDRGFVTIGRNSDNNVTLSDSSVSRYHARLVCGPHGCLLKDLKQGERVQINGEDVFSRFLQDGDIVRIGHHVLEYLAEPPSTGGVRGPADLPKATFKVRQTKPERAVNWGSDGRKAFLRYVDGPNRGHILTVDRPLVPVGDPGSYHTAVSRRTNGFYLLNLGKGFFARLNDAPIHGAGALLKNGDRITMGDDEIEVRIFEPGESQGGAGETRKR